MVLARDDLGYITVALGTVHAVHAIFSALEVDSREGETEDTKERIEEAVCIHCTVLQAGVLSSGMGSSGDRDKGDESS